MVIEAIRVRRHVERCWSVSDAELVDGSPHFSSFSAATKLCFIKIESNVPDRVLYQIS